MTARTCKCGCRVSLAGRRKGTVWATDSCRKEFSRGESPAQRGRSAPSGAQVSYFKAIKVVAAGIERVTGEPAETCRWVARDWIREALPEAQRARLEARR